MPENWLPSEPPPPPPHRSAVWRNAVLWLACILIFVSMYLSMKESKHTPEVDTSSVPWWIWPLCLACFALPFALVVWLFGSTRRVAILQGPAYEALGDGQYARSAQLFGDLARRFRAKPNVWTVAAYNQGYALIRAGDAAAAAGVLLQIERWPNLGIDGVRGLVAIELARAFVIGGDVDKAQRWLDAARARLEIAHDRAAANAQLADVEGVVLCRAGKFDDAIRHYDQSWQRLQSRLPVRHMGAVWLLRAFATSGAGTPRGAAAVETWLRLVRAVQPGSLAWLTAHWPELATFTTVHELGDTTRATAIASSQALEGLR